jgi:hypothetical protein
MMNKSDLLRMLAEAQAEREHILSRVGVERMTEPGVAGSWTVKDVVAHVDHYFHHAGDVAGWLEGGAACQHRN